jgi:hypothetical protein
LGILCIDGWDAGHKRVIYVDDRIPEKPWLACSNVKLTSKGRGIYEEASRVSLLVTHHALSRLVQRCGATHPGDLIIAVNNIWSAYLEEKHGKLSGGTRARSSLDRNGSRLRFRLSETLCAYAALERYHDDAEGSLVVATIMDT